MHSCPSEFPHYLWESQQAPFHRICTSSLILTFLLRALQVFLSRHCIPLSCSKGKLCRCCTKGMLLVKHSNISAVLSSQVSVKQEPSRHHLDCQTKFSLWFYTFSRQCKSFQSLSQQCKALAVILREEGRIHFPLKPWSTKQNKTI